MGNPSHCRCGHAAEAHEHYRPGRDCGACGCHRFASATDASARRGGVRRGARRAVRLSRPASYPRYSPPASCTSAEIAAASATSSSVIPPFECVAQRKVSVRQRMSMSGWWSCDLRVLRHPVDHPDRRGERRQLRGADDRVAVAGPSGQSGQRVGDGGGVEEFGHAAILPGAASGVAAQHPVHREPAAERQVAQRAQRALDETAGGQRVAQHVGTGRPAGGQAGRAAASPAPGSRPARRRRSPCPARSRARPAGARSTPRRRARPRRSRRAARPSRRRRARSGPARRRRRRWCPTA